MQLFGQISIVLFAGIINGSFVIPAKYIKNIATDRIWFYYSIIGLIVVPWLILFIYCPSSASNYLLLPTVSILTLIFGGVVFGVGQVCFVKAINTIGIGISFVINLGIAVLLGTLYIVIKQGLFFTKSGVTVSVATVMIVLTLILNYCIGNKKKFKEIYKKEWCLAITAGLASGLQNIVFMSVAFMDKKFISSTGHSFWVWPLFLSCASIPMMLGFFKSTSHGSRYFSIQEMYRNVILILVMGLCFTGSLVFYSLGMSGFDGTGRIIGWPIFMISIILTSQLWGMAFGESNNTNSVSNVVKLSSILILFLALWLLSGIH